MLSLNYKLGLNRAVGKERPAVQLRLCTKPLCPLNWGEHMEEPPNPGKSPALPFYISLHLLVLPFSLHLLFGHELFRTKLFNFKPLNCTS